MIPFPDISGLPRTGSVDVVTAGDDATYQVGHPSTSRFIDVGNGTVRDTLYVPELRWVKTPHLIIPGGSGKIGDDFGGGASTARGNWTNGGGDYLKGDVVSRDGGDAAPYFVSNVDHPPGASFAADVAKWDETVWIGSAADLTTAATFSWDNAIAACEALDYGGFTDWRLSNMVELFLLYNNNTGTAPSILQPFSLTADVTVWTASPRKTVTGSSYFVDFSASVQVNQQTQGNVNVAIPVRGGKINA